MGEFNEYISLKRSQQTHNDFEVLFLLWGDCKRMLFDQIKTFKETYTKDFIATVLESQ